MCQWNKRGVEQSVRDRLLVERSFKLPPPPLPSERAAPSWLRTRGHIEAEGTEEEGGVKGVTSDEWRGGGLGTRFGPAWHGSSYQLGPLVVENVGLFVVFWLLQLVPLPM